MNKKTTRTKRRCHFIDIYMQVSKAGPARSSGSSTAGLEKAASSILCLSSATRLDKTHGCRDQRQHTFTSAKQSTYPVMHGWAALYVMTTGLARTIVFRDSTLIKRPSAMFRL